MQKSEDIYQIKVTLKRFRPPIWRRLLLRGDTTLEEMHYILQGAMGWYNCHLHQFILDGVYYGEPNPDFGGWIEIEDEQKYTLDQLLPRAKSRIVYEYDFGDSWEHELLVEKILTPGDAQALHKGPLPACIKGKRAGPPEDVGGEWGYAHFLEAMSDPEHPEHEHYLGWHGVEFDPEHFDLEEVNKGLQQFR